MEMRTTSASAQSPACSLIACKLRERIYAPHAVRGECLDWLLIVGRSHLEQILRVYVQHYNGHRPHRALGLAAPDPPAGLTVVGEGAVALP
jgi:hypothetical protein